MPLTYASLAAYKRMKEIDPDQTSADNTIVDYLVRATRYIERYCRRDFLPMYETRVFAIPNRIVDLARRRYMSADIYMDKDLLEVVELTNASGLVLTENTDFFILPANVKPKFALSLLFPNFWMNGFDTTSYNFEYPNVSVEGWWGYQEHWPDRAWIDTLLDVPVAGINISQTTITGWSDVDGLDELGDTAFSIGCLIRIDDELMAINTVDPLTNTITVQRAVRGTVATAHLGGVDVTKWLVHEDIQQVCLQIAKTWREFGQTAGGRIGVSDVAPGAEITIPADPINTLKSYVRRVIT